jgi:hypothetical protein
MTALERAYRSGFEHSCRSFGADPIKMAQTVSELYGHGPGVASNELNMAADGIMAAAPIGAAVGGAGGLSLALRSGRKPVAPKPTAKAKAKPAPVTALAKTGPVAPVPTPKAKPAAAAAQAKIRSLIDSIKGERKAPAQLSPNLIKRLLGNVTRNQLPAAAAATKALPAPKYMMLLRRALTKRGSVKEAQLSSVVKALLYALTGGAAGAGTAGAVAGAVGSDIGAKKDMNEVIPAAK